MRVLVTGTDGYIGVVLAPFLLQRGYDVVGLDTGFYRDAWLYNNGVSAMPPMKNKDLRCMTIDDVAGLDAVVHSAELPTILWHSSAHALPIPSIIGAV